MGEDLRPTGESGLIEFLPENLDRVPETAGVYLLFSSGQRVLYVGAAAGGGLREALWELFEERPIAGISLFAYLTCADEQAAALARRYVEELKPPYNTGFGRFRGGDVRLPRQAHCIRRAAPNPP